MKNKCLLSKKIEKSKNVREKIKNKEFNSCKICSDHSKCLLKILKIENTDTKPKN